MTAATSLLRLCLSCLHVCDPCGERSSVAAFLSLQSLILIMSGPPISSVSALSALRLMSVSLSARNGGLLGETHIAWPPRTTRFSPQTMMQKALRSATSVRLPSTRVVPAVARRAFWASASSPEPVAATDELVAVPEVERLLRAGIRSIGYNEQDTEVMKDASASRHRHFTICRTHAKNVAHIFASFAVVLFAPQ